jgi:hypothetical protein
MSVTVVDRINAAVALSPVGTWFRLEGCGHPNERIGSRFLVSYEETHTLKGIISIPQTELRAGLTTWVSNLGGSCDDFAKLYYIGVGRDGIHCQRLCSSDLRYL